MEGAQPRQYVQRVCALLRQYVKEQMLARQYVKRKEGVLGAGETGFW